jgi:hypothetical protein
VEVSFQYDSLDNQKPSIRLVELLPKETSLGIECNYPLDVAPPYCAVSYTWGPPTPAHRILLNGQRLKVRENIYLFLQRLRQRGEGRALWVDSICINQADDREE